ncbi:hypothetical protein [Algoriphagus sp. AK58]|uniref:hypothetical protein n=1 Tax=Algoriphagus sp. AK58 TaxID=1406877 RepID=UPI001C9BDD25|nr:hypothetical protein [Algoriphagus sp. AK58]
MIKGLTYPKRIGILLVSLGVLWSSGNGFAQRINFSTWTGSDDIVITPVLASPTLNFNQKQANISINSPAVTINLSDNQAVAFRIEAPDGFDLTVEVDAPTFLSLNGIGTDSEETVPFRIGMAYNNLLAGDEMSAKAGAVQLPVGFYNVSFPVSRRSAGAPGPPPTPVSGDYVRPKSTAWLFLYGELGPIGQVNAGQYLGDVTINVYFTSND